jgi:hypothetical protein
MINKKAGFASLAFFYHVISHPDTLLCKVCLLAWIIGGYFIT